MTKNFCNWQSLLILIIYSLQGQKDLPLTSWWCPKIYMLRPTGLFRSYMKFYSSCHCWLCNWLVPISMLCLFDINANYILLTTFLDANQARTPESSWLQSQQVGGGSKGAEDFSFVQFRKWELYGVLAHIHRLMVWPPNTWEYSCSISFGNWKLNKQQ